MSITATPTFTGTWQLDPVHSTVGFEVDYMAGTFKGEFHEIGAQLAVDGDHARLAGSAKVASIDVKDENLSAHLQSPDFFDAEATPSFASPPRTSTSARATSPRAARSRSRAPCVPSR